MAIDTAEKRQNIVGIGRPYLRTHFSIATPDAEWRAATGLTYGGNTLSGPVSPSTTYNYVIDKRRRQKR